MPNSTLHSTLYQKISEYAELVDEVLIALATGRPNTALFQQLAQTLRIIIHPVRGNLANRMIAKMIFDQNLVTEIDLELVAESLEINHIDEITLEIIEKLAESLEQERTKTMARIRGQQR